MGEGRRVAQDTYSARSTLEVHGKRYRMCSLPQAERNGLKNISRLPRSLKVLLENNLRHEGEGIVTQVTLDAFSRWGESRTAEVAFYPARVMMPDSSGIPVLCDLAAMRDRMVAAGRPPELVNPVRPVDLVMDHSVVTTHAGSPDSAALNIAEEYRMNGERYTVAKWAQRAFDNLRVIPPGQGICHQINLEYLARVVWAEPGTDGMMDAFPDTLVGGDSHTTMINGLGVLGWGVGGIEAMAALLGEPVSIQLPEVVGVRLSGTLQPGVTATDLVLVLTGKLRELGVTQKFVEFFGPALPSLPVATRATIANMCPEYGASCGFFPVDRATLDYLAATNRQHLVPLVEAYTRHQGLWLGDEELDFTTILDVDLSEIGPTVAGPDLPHHSIGLGKVARTARAAIEATVEANDMSAPDAMRAGDIAIAAITSCTNTSNPDVMLAAGLLAKKAVERGLSVRPFVKTSLSPGSRVVADYLGRTGLMAPLERLGFTIAGFGCMTCGGASGPLIPKAAAAAQAGIPLTAILSGNRNFTGRVHPQVANSYLASPPLVVAYALAGTMLIDLESEPVGTDPEGRPVLLDEIWPSPEEIAALLPQTLMPENFASRYATVESGDALWRDVPSSDLPVFLWDENSQLIRKPPFLQTAVPLCERRDVRQAAILALFGDFVTTDHISPAGQIPADSNAAVYLRANGVEPSELGNYMQRRCNPDVMARGTFNNPRIRNLMLPQARGGWTLFQPTGERMWIYDAAERYRREGRPVVVFAGQGYGAGSSRDWAAKGPHLLGVEAVLAEGFERIHRSNLVGMGIVPLQIKEGAMRRLALTGAETVSIPGLWADISPGRAVTVEVTWPDGRTERLQARLRIDTEREAEWLAAGGVMPHVLANFTKSRAGFDVKETIE
ncbi:aconitate hydratase AcnA [Mesorhizobium sp. 1B3]|uniref:aconitate hydratase AcnA n=1 Tax=Mesorhizobium sp. 1B3 TaxID=3243599 RepID=UPI003D964D94